MSMTTVIPLCQPETIEDPLTAVLRSGARRLLAQAERFAAWAVTPASAAAQARSGHGSMTVLIAGVHHVKAGACTVDATCVKRAPSGCGG
jgi:hypothetical protein